MGRVYSTYKEEYWKPMEMYGLIDAFVMRYNLETQKDLPLHIDASLVTGIKLNDDYEGADLFILDKTYLIKIYQ